MGLDQGLLMQVGDSDEQPVAQWRKANQIHRWFDENVGEVENCENLEVNLEQLAGLLQTCKDVKKTPQRADELLPGVEGFFFGPTEAGHPWYMQEVENTIKQLEELFEMVKEMAPGLLAKSRFYYWAWW